MKGSERGKSVPRIESLRIRNYRALRDVEFKNLTPLTVFLGPNGSGKSTLFDVCAFLSECFTIGLRRAWDKRGRFKELRTRDCNGNIIIDLKYREPGLPLVTFHLAIGEDADGPKVAEERLSWKRGSYGRPLSFLDFKNGSGKVISGEQPDYDDTKIDENLESPELIAVNTLGQLAKNPRVSALRRFITGWHLSYLTADDTRGVPDAGPQEKLSQTGDNLPNVIQFLHERHPDRLDTILETLSRRVPRLEKVLTDILADGRLLLQIKDAPFERPILAKFASDGTLKLLSYLIVLYDPDRLPLIGIEEPENHLHPNLLPELAEECRKATKNSQLLVTTHSPFFVNGLKPNELWVFHRDEQGYTKAARASEMEGVNEFVNEGAQLGHLWVEGHFNVGDPLRNSGGPSRTSGARM